MGLSCARFLVAQAWVCGVLVAASGCTESTTSETPSTDLSAADEPAAPTPDAQSPMERNDTMVSPESIPSAPEPDGDVSEDSGAVSQAVEDREEVDVVQEMPTPPSVDEALHAIRKQLILDEAALSTEASNEGSALEVLERLERMFTQLDVLERIPEKPEASQLKRQIRLSAKEAGFRAGEIKVIEEGPIAQGVPSLLVGNTKVHYLPGQLRGVLKVSFLLKPIKIQALEVWLKQLPALMKRMLRVESVAAEPSGFRVQARAFFFGTEVFPTHKPEMKTFLRYLRDQGLQGDLKTLRDQASEELWEKTKTTLATLIELEPAATRTLTLYSRANLLESRWAFFEQMAKAIEAQNIQNLLK